MPATPLYVRYCWGCHGYTEDGNGEKMENTSTSAAEFCRRGLSNLPINARRVLFPTDEDFQRNHARPWSTPIMPPGCELNDQQARDLLRRSRRVFAA